MSLDESVWLTDRRYLSTALDHEIMEEVSHLSLEEKDKLLNSLRRKQNSSEAE